MPTAVGRATKPGLPIHSRETRIRHLRVAVLRRTLLRRQRRARIRASTAVLRLGVRGCRALLVVRWVKVRSPRRRRRRRCRGWLLLLQRRQRMQRRQHGRAIHSMWGRGRARGAKVRGPLAVWVGRALRARRGVHVVLHVVLLVLHAARAMQLDAGTTGGRRALAVVAAFAAQGLVGGRGRGAGAAVAVVDGVFHVFVELLEEEGALEAHLLDAPVEPRDAEPRAVVVLFDVVDAAA